MAYMIIIGIFAICAVYCYLAPPTFVGSMNSTPDKLGWMDDLPFTKADQARVASIGGAGFADNLGVISSMQWGTSSSVTRRDFELMRQDSRRAMAAYPALSDDLLFSGSWISVDIDARVPEKWGGMNSNGTKIGEEWFLDGGAYLSFVKPQYPNRASASETKAYFVARKAKQRQEKIDRLAKDGPFVWWGGSGGSMSVKLNERREVVITRAQEWARTATRWTMPFVVDDWADTNESDLDAIKKLPSFAQAAEETIDIQPSGMTMTMGADQHPAPTSSNGGFILGPGETMGITVPVGRAP